MRGDGEKKPWVQEEVGEVQGEEGEGQDLWGLQSEGHDLARKAVTKKKLVGLTRSEGQCSDFLQLSQGLEGAELVVEEFHRGQPHWLELHHQPLLLAVRSVNESVYVSQIRF